MCDGTFSGVEGYYEVMHKLVGHLSYLMNILKCTYYYIFGGCSWSQRNHGVSFAHISRLMPINTHFFRNSFRSRSLCLINKGSSSWTMSHFTNLMKYNKLLKMFDTFISVAMIQSISQYCRMGIWTRQRSWLA